LLAATARALTWLSRIIKSITLEAASAKHASAVLELLAADSSRGSGGVDTVGIVAIHDLFVKLLQAGEQGGMGICYTYRSCVLLLTAPIVK